MANTTFKLTMNLCKSFVFLYFINARHNYITNISIKTYRICFTNKHGKNIVCVSAFYLDRGHNSCQLIDCNMMQSSSLIVNYRLSNSQALINN